MYHLQVITPEQMILDKEILALIAPGKNGYFGVLSNHSPLLASLKSGILIITDKAKIKSYYKISSGFLEVSHNKASILVDTIEPTSFVDIGIQGEI